MVGRVTAVPANRVPQWVPDVLPGFQQTTLVLGADPDGEGDLVATLVRRAGSPASQRAVLAVHGFTDYFFNTQLVDHLTAGGFRVYGLDLRKCGRSWREGQTPHFTTDLARYDRELDLAMEIIRAENGLDNASADPAECENTVTLGAEGDGSFTLAQGPVQTVVYGHSTGGLVVSLWLDRLHRRGETASSGLIGLVLNSPFLDLRGPGILRTRVTSTALGAVSRVRKTRVLRPGGQGGYGLTLHRDYHGEFDYDLKWKPLGGFPITVGWLHAIRRGQATLHRGLDVGVPNLILRSDRTVAEAGIETMQRGDAVLDVAHIARWAGCIGNRQTVVPVAEAKHDVFLSLAGPRAMAYAALDDWLARL